MVRELMAAAGVVWCAAGAMAQSTAASPAAIVYAERAAPGQDVWRAWDEGAWSGASGVWSGAEAVVWNELRVCSDWTRMALLSVDWSRSARLHLWDGSAWAAPLTVCTDVGTRAGKGAAVAYEHLSGRVLAVYRSESAATLRYRVYDGAMSAEAAIPSLTLNAAPRWITLVAKPGSDEVLMVAATGSRLYAAVWDGSSWGGQVTLETSLPGQGRAFDAAYMRESGEAVVVWGRSSGAPRARVWTGLTWGATAALPSTGGNVRWVSLAASPSGSSNDVLLATLDTGSRVSLNRFDGLAWGSFTSVTTGAAATDQPRVGVAYQPDGQGAVAAWHESGQDALRYRTWNGVAWSGTQAGPDIGMATYRVELVPGREEGEVLLAARAYTPGGIQDYVMYSSGGNVEPEDSVVEGPTGAKVSGVSLPTPPAGGSGSQPRVYGNGQTVTLAPGTYKQLSFGNACIANLGAGTYRYEYLQAGNTLTMNFDTSGGDITFILYNGNLQTMNNEVFRNTGPGRVTIHLLNGDFQLKNNAIIENVDVVAYNGNIEIGDNAQVSGLLHAKGNVKVLSGLVEPPSYFWSGAGRLSAAVWTGGVPSAPVVLSSTPQGSPVGGVVALADRPAPSRRKITRWREVDPTR